MQKTKIFGLSFWGAVRFVLLLFPLFQFAQNTGDVVVGSGSATNSGISVNTGAIDSGDVVPTGSGDALAISTGVTSNSGTLVSTGITNSGSLISGSLFSGKQISGMVDTGLLLTGSGESFTGDVLTGKLNPSTSGESFSGMVLTGLSGQFTTGFMLLSGEILLDTGVSLSGKGNVIEKKILQPEPIKKGFSQYGFPLEYGDELPYQKLIKASYHSSAPSFFLQEVYRKELLVKSITFTVDTSFVKNNKLTKLFSRDLSNEKKSSFTVYYNPQEQKIEYESSDFLEVPILWVNGVQSRALKNDGNLHTVVISYSQPFFGKVKNMNTGLVGQIVGYDKVDLYDLMYESTCYNKNKSVIKHSRTYVPCIKN